MSTAMEATALLPCLASSIVAYSTFALFITPRPIFVVPPLSFHGLSDLPLFAVLAVVCAVVGWFYVRLFYGMRATSSDPCPSPGTSSRPWAASGSACWLWYPRADDGRLRLGAVGDHRHAPDLALSDASVFVPQMSLGHLYLLALFKIVATSLTISSGGAAASTARRSSLAGCSAARWGRP